MFLYIRTEHANTSFSVYFARFENQTHRVCHFPPSNLKYFILQLWKSILCSRTINKWLYVKGLKIKVLCVSGSHVPRINWKIKCSCYRRLCFWFLKTWPPGQTQIKPKKQKHRIAIGETLHSSLSHGLLPLPRAPRGLKPQEPLDEF